MADSLLDPKDLRVRVFVEGGHAFETDEDGELDEFENGIHTNVFCALCDESLCIHCEPDWASQQCEDRAQALPGLELPVENKS